MVQFEGIGGGQMSTSFYQTWKIEYCNDCDRYVLEDYTAQEIHYDEVQLLSLNSSNLIKKEKTKWKKQNKKE